MPASSSWSGLALIRVGNLDPTLINASPLQSDSANMNYFGKVAQFNQCQPALMISANIKYFGKAAYFNLMLA